MSSPAQIAANRLNAQLSTGPATPEGKEATRHNATRHGLTGSQVVIKGENPAEYDALRTALINQHAPASEHEAMLVEEIAQNWWRLQRARRTEKQVIEKFGELEVIIDPVASRAFKTITRYLNQIERSWRHACSELERIQKERLKNEMNRAAARAFAESIRSGQIGSVSQIQYPPLGTPRAAAVSAPLKA